MVEAVELRDPGIGLGIVLAELILGFSLLVAALEEIVPLLESLHRLRQAGISAHMYSFAPGWLRLKSLSFSELNKNGLSSTGASQSQERSRARQPPTLSASGSRCATPAPQR